MCHVCWTLCIWIFCVLWVFMCYCEIGSSFLMSLITPPDILSQAAELPNLNSICSFCSRMKRGRLYAAARRNNCNVLAFGQHLDDLAESFMMSVFHNGRLRTMKAHYSVKYVNFAHIVLWFIPCFTPLFALYFPFPLQLYTVSWGDFLASSTGKRTWGWSDHLHMSERRTWGILLSLASCQSSQRTAQHALRPPRWGSAYV